MYKKPICLTQQFRFCGNAFRVDTYRGCDFGCKYCFANSRNGNFSCNFDETSVEILDKFFAKALETDKEYKDINVELLRNRVPLHLGGMSDPFQTREWDMGLTYHLIELSNKYNYPMSISTKTAKI